MDDPVVLALLETPRPRPGVVGVTPEQFQLARSRALDQMETQFGAHADTFEHWGRIVRGEMPAGFALRHVAPMD